MTGTSDIGGAAFRWWSEDLNDRGPGRMARAQLRRCSTTAEAMAIPATHALHSKLGQDMRYKADTLALIAISLAVLREDSPHCAARRMGESMGENGRGRLSALRFQTLIRAKTAGELIRPLRRALMQIGEVANVSQLATDLYWWNEKTRNNWCFDYYGAGFADPAAPETDTSPETEART